MRKASVRSLRGLSKTKNHHLTGKAPYEFESGFLVSDRERNAVGCPKLELDGTPPKRLASLADSGERRDYGGQWDRAAIGSQPPIGAFAD
jgi:hypothetical protein